MRLKRTVIVITLIGMLQGCFDDDKAKGLFVDYSERLANVVETSPIPPSESRAIKLPRKRDLVVPIEDTRMGLLDAYELRQCGLFQLIADRNSILGKVQDAFRQLNYELALLRTLNQCLEDVTSEPLSSELKRIQVVKRNQIHLVYWNTFASSDAWRSQLTPPSISMISPDTPFAHSEALLAIESYSSLLANPSSRNVLELQEPIEKQRYLGALFYSMDESTRWLNAATEQLERDDARVLCGKNRNTTRFTYLQNVFSTFFIDGVQPYLSKINGLYLDAQPSLVRLHQRFGEMPPFTDYSAAYFSGEHYDEFQDAVKNHVAYWQTLFKRCGVKIGR
ncbi:DUF3080 domain-containing protein [Enterovibrio sp. ZSDZ35]|uniref:DUF3080 domain-containing protein n=1 Tax=Enterovibrio qingdaonensis TaxID=2899818 RepID=A0ABT5QJG7_9GAMM|nr:DUF3080 domain-containing protein [Enterovibrio sp. ZSDZ35]MDD1780813.1 DUF3080 domain-containing protein [Enterovibrio sp. ZSDZ35]